VTTITLSSWQLTKGDTQATSGFIVAYEQRLRWTTRTTWGAWRWPFDKDQEGHVAVPGGTAITGNPAARVMMVVAQLRYRGLRQFTTDGCSLSRCNHNTWLPS
jgi:hypothetical protein